MQDFAQTQPNFQLLLDNRHHNITADCNPDLGLHGVVTGAEKSFDSQVVLEPFENNFYLPFIVNKTSTTFDPGTMTDSTTFYWRIDEADKWGTTTGPIHLLSIMTSPPPPPT